MSFSTVEANRPRTFGQIGILRPVNERYRGRRRRHGRPHYCRRGLSKKKHLKSKLWSDRLLGAIPTPIPIPIPIPIKLLPEEPLSAKRILAF
jgi:hypothetical protein